MCGLSLDEQSYYEKSNPSLGDRGVTQDLKDTERPDVLPGHQNTKLEKDMCNEQKQWVLPHFTSSDG